MKLNNNEVMEDNAKRLMKVHRKKKTLLLNLN